MTFCPHCQHPLDEHDVMCPSCNAVLSESEPDAAPVSPTTVEPPAIVEAPLDEQPPKKRKPLLVGLLIGGGALLLAAIVVIVGLLLGWWGNLTDKHPPVKPGTPEELASAIDALSTFDSFTVSLEADVDVSDPLYTTEAVAEPIKQSTVLTAKIDRKNEAALIESTVTDGDGTTIEKTGRDGAYLYSFIREGDRAPRCSTSQDEIAASEFWKSVDTLMTVTKKSSAEFSTEELATLQELADEGVIDLEGYKKCYDKMIARFADEAWLKETLGYKATVEKNRQVYIFRFDAAKLAQVLYEDYREAFTAETLDSLSALLNEAELDAASPMPCELKLYVEGGVLTELYADIAFAGNTLKATVKFSDFNSTVIDFTALKNEILDANDGFTDCRFCAYMPAEREGYCYSCYYSLFCYNDCGNTIMKDGYCEDCYDPCADCEAQSAYDAPDGKSYCYECYPHHYCYTLDDNPAYIDGYCEECFVPCSICGARQGIFGEETIYCDTCYRERFCLSYDDNPVYKDGYCEDCFEPCPNCGDYAAMYPGALCMRCDAAASGTELFTCAHCGIVLYTVYDDDNGLCYDCCRSAERSMRVPPYRLG